MKCNITRTSLWDEYVAPCEEAFLSTYTRRDVRNVDSPEKLSGSRSESQWKEFGTNHRVENGCIVRDYENEKCWCVEITTLEALLEFSNKYGDLVIDKNHRGYMPEIEIYDSYRE